MDIRTYLEKVKTIIDAIDAQEVQALVDLIYDAYKNDKTIFVIGNGGSAASASHLAQDLSKGVLLDQSIEPRIRAHSLTDNVAYISALGNDDGYDRIFEAQLRTFSKPGDILLAISGSGNSKNIIKAIDFCEAKGISVVGVTGYDGGELKKRCQHNVHVPLNEMCTAESIHTVIFHYLIIELRERILGTAFDISCLSINTQ